jgi:plasmid stabilization system protein ParE
LPIAAVLMQQKAFWTELTISVKLSRSFLLLGRNRDELMENVRSFPIDDYLIFYSAIEAGIEVLRVVSGYRDLEDLFSE